MKKLRKILINFVVFSIPRRQSRNNWRNILSIGLFKSLNKIDENRCAGKFKYFLVVCAIVKNEPDLVEWIEFNKKAGVEKFYIYDNESTDDIKKRLAPYVKSGLVEYTYFKHSGKSMQTDAYTDYLNKHRFETKWTAFIDADEYLLPLRKNLIDVLKKLPVTAAGLVLPWLCFGSSGYITRPKGGTVKNYLHRMPIDLKLQHAYKSIVNPRLVVLPSPHICYGWGRSYDARLNRLTIPGNMKLNLPMEDIVVAHYWCKSKNDFEEKWAKPGDRWVETRLSNRQKEFIYRDRNEVYDDRALMFMKGKKK